MLSFVASIVLCTALAEDGDSYAPTQERETPYVFSWPGHPTELSLRGGTTKGAEVTVLDEPSEAWTRLQDASLSALERDRAAILALAGDYRATFDFLEIERFDGENQPAQPYRSWGTERIHVLVDEPERIVLQHVMTMYVVDDEGEVSEPMVVKHWRQDWRWEPDTILAFQGLDTFEVKAVSEAHRAGQWSQTVFQVDDTPRYALMGAWSHNGSYSEWVSGDGWRPLPRRERTARDDYQVLAGWNRLTVHPTGWVHFQDNRKTVLTAPGEVNAESPVVARELGVNRYDRVVGFDFSPGDAYWAATQPYWRMVQAHYDERVRTEGTFVVRAICGEQRTYERFFELASPLAEGRRYRPRRVAKQLAELLECISS